VTLPVTQTAQRPPRHRPRHRDGSNLGCGGLGSRAVTCQWASGGAGGATVSGGGVPASGVAGRPPARVRPGPPAPGGPPARADRVPLGPLALAGRARGRRSSRSEQARRAASSSSHIHGCRGTVASAFRCTPRLGHRGPWPPGPPLSSGLPNLEASLTRRLSGPGLQLQCAQGPERHPPRHKGAQFPGSPSGSIWTHPVTVSNI
jgi:hypothetical protein